MTFFHFVALSSSTLFSWMDLWADLHSEAQQTICSERHIKVEEKATAMRDAVLKAEFSARRQRLVLFLFISWVGWILSSGY